MASDSYSSEAAVPINVPLPTTSSYQSSLLSAGASAVGDDSHPSITAKVSLASASPNDAATNATAANAFLNAGQTADNLGKQSPQVQQAVWQNLTAQQQKVLASAGYQPASGPTNQKGEVTQSKQGGVMGFLGSLPGVGRVAHDVNNDVLKPAERDVLKPALGNRAVHDVLNALGSPLRAVQHIQRTGFLVSTNNEQGTPVGIFSSQTSKYSGTEALGQLFSPSAWEKAWNATSNGQKFIQPVVKRQVQQQYGNQIYHLALQVAQGDTAQQVVKGLPKAQQAGAMQILQSAKGQAAISALNDGHLTFGQEVLGQHNLVSKPWTHNISGALDAIFDWYGDPAGAAAKTGKAVKELSVAANTGSDVERIFNTTMGAKTADRMAELVRNKDAVGFMQSFPKYQQLYKNLAADGADTAEKVVDSMKGYMDTAHVSAFPRANIPGISQGGVVMPKLTYGGMARTAIRQQLEKVQSWGDLSEARVQGVKASELGTKEIGGAVAHTSGMMHPLITLSTKVGSAARKMLTYVPQAINHGEFNLESVAGREKYIEQLYNAAKMSLPIARAKELTNSMIERLNEDPGAFKQAAQNFNKEIGLAAGMAEGTPEMKEYMDKFAGSINSQAYGTGSIAHMEDDTGTSTAALFENQMSDPYRFNLPDYKLVRAAVKKGATGKMMGLTDKYFGPLVSLWSKAVLARPAFGIRVASDEGVIGALREGPAQLAKSRILASGVKALVRLSPMDVEDLEDAGLFKRWFGDLDQNELDELRSRYARPEWKFDNMSKDAREDHIDAVKQYGAANPRVTLEGMDHVVDQMSRSEIVAYLRREMGEDATGITTSLLRNIYRQAMGRLATVVSKDYERDALARYMKYGGHDTFMRYISTSEGGGYEGGRMSDALARRQALDLVGKDGKLIPAEMHATGAYKELGNSDVMFNKSLQKYYQSIAHSAWGRTAAAGIGKMEEADLREQVADVMQESDVWNKMAVRAHKLSTGELVDEGEATTRQAALDHADKVIKQVKAITTGGFNQEHDLQNVRDLLAQGETPSRQTINGLQAENKLPQSVVGPEMVRVMHDTSKAGVFNRMTNAQWEKIIAPQIDWAVREPLTVREYIIASKSMDPFFKRMAERAGDSDVAAENWELEAHRSAMQQAFNNIDPYVHNPELRTQFHTITRNLAPFAFAQQQFYRRWGLSIMAAPWSARQLQLVNGGIHHNGFVHQEMNSQGQEEDYFVYPGSEMVQGVLGRTIGLLTGNGSVQVPGALTGSPDSLIAGQTIEMPSGPLMEIPMKLLGKLDPQLEPLTNAVNGQAASSENMLQMLLPSDLYHVLQAAAPESFDAAGYASAQMQAIQYLEATGHGLGTPALNNLGTLSAGATPEQYYKDHSGLQSGDYVTGQNGEEWVYTSAGTWQQTTTANEAKLQQQYLYRVNAWTKSFLMLRAFTGAFVSSAPQTQIGGQVGQNGLYQKMLEYTNTIPNYDQAMAAFVKANPDAQPYDIVESQTQGSSSPTGYATQAAQNWIDQNSSFVSAHGEAAMYFLPLADAMNASKTKGLTAYSEQAEKRQVAMGLRSKDPTSDNWTTIAYEEAATPFYQAESNLYTELAKYPNNQQMQDQIYNDFDTWKQGFLSANPIFAQQYEDNTAPTQRVQLMTDVKNALNDPNVPQTAQTLDIQTLYNAWSNWYQMIHGANGDGIDTPTSDQKQQINTDFADWAYSFTQSHPDTQMLYNKAIRPDLSSVLDPTNYIPVNMVSNQQATGAALNATGNPQQQQPTNG